MPDVTFTVPTLKKGSNPNAPGQAVERLQNLLNTIGSFGLDEDGVFGPATETAVKQSQAKLNLTKDGIVGKATWTALFKTWIFGSLPG
ncbi:MAG: N-acetylmuramoyl-L-alanine amidase [bacterium]|jgi:N-acetylmuramoyl-L-alanine amidase